MNNVEEKLKDIQAIRLMMERSNKFISLSGLSGVIAGFAALGGAAMARFKLTEEFTRGESQTVWNTHLFEHISHYRFFILDAIIVFVVAIGAGIIPTVSRAKKKRQDIFNPAAFRMLYNLLIPVITGGIYCMILFHDANYGMIAPAMLIFYGFGLVNASHYTLSDIRYLGYIEIVLGLINAFNRSSGLYFWAIGFGVMHIFYGLYMYFKYERKN